MRLKALGWDDTLADSFAPWAGTPDVEPARVVIEFNHIYRVRADDAELEATASGRLKHHARQRSELPAVGDWVVIRRRSDGHASIIAVLPRRSAFSRRMAGAVTGEQVVAANVDIVFLVMALDADFSPRRLERYMLLARESGASPVILLTKPDMAPALDAQVARTVTMAGDLPVHVVSPKHGEGMADVAQYLTPGRTGALLGSSGVGKSTIINRLVGQDVQKTREVREADAKGRHTTIHRELVVLPGGGLLIDTPGMRELQLWDVGASVRETFDDIEALAPHCRFADCRHRAEPGCAVRLAVDERRLDQARVEGYLRLQDELALLARRQDERARLDEKRRGRMPDRAPGRRPKTKRL